MPSLENKLCVYFGEEKTFAYLIESFAKRLGFDFAMSPMRAFGDDGVPRTDETVIACVDLEGVDLRADEASLTWKKLNLPEGLPLLIFSWTGVTRGEETPPGRFVVQKPVSFRDFQDALALAGVITNHVSP